MKKNRIATIALVLIFAAGLALLLYPTVSDLWNAFHQSRAITEYTHQVEETDEETYERLWTEAERYNQELMDDPDRFTMTDADKAEYEQLLSIDGDGVMGYVEVPKINCSLPVYHGTDEAALQVAIGHLEGSSLPTGGKGTHCVLSGHRGLPSARLFTDLDEMTEGDIFLLKVLDRTMTYEVDQILTVDPYDLDALAIDPDQDYCTLVTCTPYGINTHRLLVRGHRIPNLPEESVQQVAVNEQTVLIASAAALAVSAVVIVVVLLARARRKR